MLAWKWVVRLSSAIGLLLAWTAPAFAAEPASANSLQLGAGFRYGFELQEGDFNPWGPGLGLSIGYTLPNALYLGGNFDYFFGETEETPPIKVTGNIWQLMAELGYDIGLGESLVLRPKAGAGVASLKGEMCPVIASSSEFCGDISETDFALAPGATFLYLGKSFSLTLDLRYDIIFEKEESVDALILAAGIGF